MDSQKIIDAIENGKLADASDYINDILLSRIGAALEERKTELGETLIKGVDVQEEEDSEYDRFFRAALKKFGVSSPADFDSEEEKKKFFNYVDKNFKAKNESVDLDEASSLVTSSEEKELKQAIAMYRKMKDSHQIDIPSGVCEHLSEREYQQMTKIALSLNPLWENALRRNCTKS